MENLVNTEELRIAEIEKAIEQYRNECCVYVKDGCCDGEICGQGPAVKCAIDKISNVLHGGKLVWVKPPTAHRE